jgi:hypothetical protein
VSAAARTGVSQAANVIVAVADIGSQYRGYRALSAHGRS